MLNSRKKIYTLTFHHVLNNGGVIQAYALQRFLKESGFETKIINYLPTYFLFQTYRPAKGFMKTWEKIKKIRTFAKFRKHFLEIDSQVIRASSQLAKIDDAYAVIVGSDQVWNPRLTGGNVDRTFYLESLPAGTKKISYAASSGGESLLKNSELVTSWLSSFTFLGVRESGLSCELESELGLEGSEVVLDPSLIIDDYSEVIDSRRVPEGGFLLTYIVASGDTLRSFDAYISKLKASLGVKVVHIGVKDINSADVTMKNVGPREWLAFIQKAGLVVTNSFHGVALSLKFERQFVFFPNHNEALNQRQETLLASLALEGRTAEKFESASFKLPQIDYESISPRLNKMVEKSRESLLKALN